MLNRTLASLLSVRGLDVAQTFIVQDGREASVAEAVRWHNARLAARSGGPQLTLVQHDEWVPAGRTSRGHMDLQQRGEAADAALADVATTETALDHRRREYILIVDTC